MPTGAMIGHTTTFEIESATPGTYTPVAEVLDVTPPGLSRDAVDATNSGSTDGWREYVAGLKDGGEVSFELNFIPGGTAETAIFAEFAKDVTTNYRITFPNADTWIFAGFITGFEPSAPQDDRMTATATFKLSGKPAFLTA